MDDTLSQKIMDIIGDISPRISTVELEDFAAEAAALEEEIERLRGALEALGYIPCTFKEDRQDRLAGTCIDGTVVCESSGYICEDCEGTGWIYDPIAAAQEASR